MNEYDPRSYGVRPAAPTLSGEFITTDTRRFGAALSITAGTSTRGHRTVKARIGDSERAYLSPAAMRDIAAWLTEQADKLEQEN